MNTPHKHGFLAATAVAIPAMLIGSGLSAPPAQAAYSVMLQEVGTSVVASGSGTSQTNFTTGSLDQRRIQHPTKNRRVNPSNNCA
jgi:hypothetical protein